LFLGIKITCYSYRLHVEQTLGKRGPVTAIT